MKAQYQTVKFKDSAQWQKWLDAHYDNTDGVWLRFYKKRSGVKSVTYAQALDVALCYGWIDSQVKKYDALSYVQKFTPRRVRSMWSKRNIEYVDRLTKAGLMMPGGLAEVKRAQTDGRWQEAYDSPKNMAIPEDFLLAVRKNKRALAFFETLGKTTLYIIGLHLQTAKKPETRARRFTLLLKMLEKGEKIQ